MGDHRRLAFVGCNMVAGHWTSYYTVSISGTVDHHTTTLSIYYDIPISCIPLPPPLGDISHSLHPSTTQPSSRLSPVSLPLSFLSPACPPEQLPLVRSTSTIPPLSR